MTEDQSDKYRQFCEEYRLKPHNLPIPQLCTNCGKMMEQEQHFAPSQWARALGEGVHCANHSTWCRNCRADYQWVYRRKESGWQAMTGYNRSPKGKAARARYEASEKGRSTRSRYRAKKATREVKK